MSKRDNRRPRYGLEVPFEAAVRRMPAGGRAGLAAWLQTWQRHRQRMFYAMDETGRWFKL